MRIAIALKRGWSAPVPCDRERRRTARHVSRACTHRVSAVDLAVLSVGVWKRQTACWGASILFVLRDVRSW